MAALQRSSNTFRREGSSGMVWDEKLLSKFEELVRTENNLVDDYRDTLKHSHSVGVSVDVMRAADHNEVVTPVYMIRSRSAAPSKQLPPKSGRRKLGNVFRKLPVPASK